MNNYLLDGEETERLLFRSIRISDYNEWLKFFENDQTSKYWIANYGTPESECRNWYERQFMRYETDMGGMNALIEKESRRLIGHCGLLKQTVDNIIEIEIGYSLLPSFWNRGFATEAAAKCKTFAFQRKLSTSLISIISLSNMPSTIVAKKIGMSLDKSTWYGLNEVNIFRVNL